MRANVASWIAIVIALVVVICFHQQPWTALRITGAVVCAAAMVMLSVARYQLGRSFSVSAQAKHLVTSGIYSRIRNPIYVAGEVFFIGVALFLPSWIPIVIVLVTIPVQVMRARRETAVLRSAFGDEYEAYRRETWF